MHYDAVKYPCCWNSYSRMMMMMIPNNNNVDNDYTKWWRWWWLCASFFLMVAPFAFDSRYFFLLVLNFVKLHPVIMRILIVQSWRCYPEARANAHSFYSIQTQKKILCISFFFLFAPFFIPSSFFSLSLYFFFSSEFNKRPLKITIFMIP